MGILYPTSAQIRPVNPVLQNRLRGYFNDDDAYIADQVLPTVANADKTGTLMSVALASGFGDVSDTLIRGYKSAYHRSAGPQLGTSTWLCEEYGNEALVDLQMLADADVPIDLEYLESRVALEDLRIWQERRAQALLFNTATFTQNVTLAGADQWSAATGDPIDDVDTAVRTVYGAIGKAPNTMALGFLPWRTVLKSPALLSYRPNNADRNMLALEDFKAMMKSLFGIDNVFIGRAHYNTANQGQTASMSPIWGDMVWIGRMEYSAPAARIGAGSAAVDASAALRFVNTDLVSEEYDEPALRSKVIRHRHIMDEVVVNATSGYIINDVTA